MGDILEYGAAQERSAAVAGGVALEDGGGIDLRKSGALCLPVQHACVVHQGRAAIANAYLRVCLQMRNMQCRASRTATDHRNGRT